ncbi:unnamed protein product, partial [Mesorhabditis belari]|uniref:Uncharacterized protein n=1 Tax=Mesorhabditis belari TaxID=2138241 RepID=A0AAF3EFL0_9BILA
MAYDNQIATSRNTSAAAKSRDANLSPSRKTGIRHCKDYPPLKKTATSLSRVEEFGEPVVDLDHLDKLRECNEDRARTASANESTSGDDGTTTINK